MNTPEFSIIVPIYHAEAYLSQCIDSVLNQTFPDFELLLIDDGSPDNCGKICDEYAKKDARIRVFHQENGGVSAARNVGLNEAVGEWVTFLDADDWWAENFLERMLSVAQESKAEAVFCNCFNVSENETVPHFIYTEDQTEDEILRRLLIKFGTRTELWGKIIRRKYLNHRLMKDVAIGEDLLYLMELYVNHDCKTAIIKDPLYYYRQVNDSAMNSRNLVQHNWVLLRKYEQLLEQHPEIEQRFPRENAIFIVRLVSSILKRDFFTESKNTYLIKRLKDNYKNAKGGLLRSEKRFLRLLLIHPIMGYFAIVLERMITKLYYN